MNLDNEGDWFPVRVTSVPVAGQYVWQECWLGVDGLIADRIGGRVNTATDPGYAIDGSTFAVTAAGSAVQCLARRGPGAAGQKWELKATGGLPVQYGGSSEFSLTPTVYVPFGVALDMPAGYYLAFASGYALGSGSPATFEYGLQLIGTTGRPAATAVTGYNKITVPDSVVTPIHSIGQVRLDAPGAVGFFYKTTSGTPLITITDFLTIRVRQFGT